MLPCCDSTNAGCGTAAVGCGGRRCAVPAQARADRQRESGVRGGIDGVAASMNQPSKIAVQCPAGGFDSKVPAPWPDSTMPTTTPYWISWTLWYASRCSSPTGHTGEPGFDAGDDPRVRRGTTRRPWGGRSGPHRACPVLRRARNRHPGLMGQPPPTRGPRLVHPATRGGGSGLALGRDPTARPGRETPRNDAPPGNWPQPGGATPKRKVEE